MILTSVSDMNKVGEIPIEIRKVIEINLKILDDNYGVDRKLSDTGGAVIIAENAGDYKIIKELLNYNHDLPYEYKDLIITKESKKVFTIALYLIGSEYGLIIIKELYPYI